MLKKVFLGLLIIWAMLFAAGCQRVIVRTVCDCDCCECGDRQDDYDRHNDPGEYEGWRD